MELGLETSEFSVFIFGTDAPSSGAQFLGYLARPRVYNTVLTEEEIQAIYKELIITED